MSEAFEGRAGGMAAYQELAEALEERYFAILRVEPEADQALVLQSVDNPEHMGKTLSWTAHLERYGAFLAEPAREKTMRRLSARALLESCRRGERGISLSLDYVRGGRTNWVTIVTRNRVQKDGRFRCFVFVRQTNEEHLRQRIIDLYVYNTCDFFICLDARNNSYVMFSGSESDTPLPPEICDDYEALVVDYTRDFVVPEDREMVIREMRTARVLEQLERHGVHNIYFGVEDPVRGYTRKQLRYQYYDRRAQLILFSRSDVTGIYLEERARQKELREARRRAETDPLTGLYNYGGIGRRISRILEEDAAPSALLFLDLDNFKQINDSMGHQEGDRLLRKVSRVLQMQSGEGALQGRVGGDEFVVFLRRIRGREQAADCARRICEAVSRLSLPENGSLPISCSIGVALAPEDGWDYRTLCMAADRRAYRAKAQGKNRFLL